MVLKPWYRTASTTQNGYSWNSYKARGGFPDVPTTQREQLPDLHVLDDMVVIHATLEDLEAQMNAKFAVRTGELRTEFEELVTRARVERGVDWLPDSWTEQVKTAHQIDSVERWGKALTVALVVYGLMLAGYYLYSLWQAQSTTVIMQ